jgi:hypothetical protein
MNTERWLITWSPEQHAIFLEREGRVFSENKVAYLVPGQTFRVPLAAFDTQEEAERYVEVNLKMRIVRIAKPLRVVTGQKGVEHGTN